MFFISSADEYISKHTKGGRMAQKNSLEEIKIYCSHDWKRKITASAALSGMKMSPFIREKLDMALTQSDPVISENYIKHIIFIENILIYLLKQITEDDNTLESIIMDCEQKAGLYDESTISTE